MPGSSAGCNVEPLLRRGPLLGFVLAALAPFLLYVFTMPTGVVVEDDGLFLMNGVFLGVQHPPGYPVFTVVHHLFQEMPFGSPAVKGHLLSAVFAALTCGFVFLVASRLGAGGVSSVLGAWMLAVCEHFWSQAIITEVYTLNALLFFVVLFCLVDLWRDPVRLWPWLLASVCYGLGLANNWPLMVLSAPALLLALWPLRRQLTSRLPVSAGVLAVSVGVPYAWLYSHSRSGPDFSFAEPFGGLTDFFYYLARRYYVDVDVHSSWGLQDFLGYLAWLGQDVFYQTAFLGVVVLLLGLGWLVLPSRWSFLPEPDRWARWFAVSGVGALLCNSVLLLFFLRNEYDSGGLNVFQPYPLVAYGVLAVLFALGLGVLVRALGLGVLVLGHLPKVVLVSVLGLVLVGSSLAMSWEKGDRRNDDFAERYADFVFDSVGEGSALLVSGDLSTHVLGYRHFVVGDRPDLRLINVEGLMYPTNFVRSSRLHDDVLYPQLVEHYVGHVDRDVHFAFASGFPHMGGVNVWWRGATGLLTVGDSRSGGSAHRLTDLGVEYGEWLLDASLDDGRERLERNVLLYTYCSYLPSIYELKNPQDAERLAGLEASAWDDPYCLQGMVSPVLEALSVELYEKSVAMGSFGAQPLPEGVDIGRVEDWLVRARELSDSGKFDQYSKFDAELLNSMGKLRLLQGRPEEASRYFERSVEIYSNELNLGLMAADW